MACHLLLEDRTGKTDFDYKENGNVLLDRLHGATIERCPANPDMNGAMEKAASRAKSPTASISPIKAPSWNTAHRRRYPREARTKAFLEQVL